MPPKPIDYLGLTEEQFSLFRRACHETLQSIFSDAFSGSVPRSDVIEIVLDQLSDESIRGKRAAGWPVLYKTVINPWITLHFSQPKFAVLMKQVFPHQTYSL